MEQEGYWQDNLTAYLSQHFRSNFDFFKVWSRNLLVSMSEEVDFRFSLSFCLREGYERIMNQFGIKGSGMILVRNISMASTLGEMVRERSGQEKMKICFRDKMSGHGF